MTVMTEEVRRNACAFQDSFTAGLKIIASPGFSTPVSPSTVTVITSPGAGFAGEKVARMILLLSPWPISAEVRANTVEESNVPTSGRPL